MLVADRKSCRYDKGQNEEYCQYLIKSCGLLWLIRNRNQHSAITVCATLWKNGWRTERVAHTVLLWSKLDELIQNDCYN